LGTFNAVMLVFVIPLTVLTFAAIFLIQLRSRRGSVIALARIDNGLSVGQVFLPFCYHEAAANLLTNEALDPDGKIPEFKFCAVRLERAGSMTT